MKKHLTPQRCPRCHRFPHMTRREPDFNPATEDQVKFLCCKITAIGSRRNDAVRNWNLKVDDFFKLNLRIEQGQSPVDVVSTESVP